MNLFRLTSGLLVIFFAGLFCETGFAVSKKQENIPKLIQWEYSPSDISFDKSINNQLETLRWIKITPPLKPQLSGKENLIWMKTIIPKITNSSKLYLASVDQDFEAYIDEKLVYKNGELSKTGKGKFVDWSPHFIDISAKDSGKTLYLRIYSNYSNIGITNTPKLLSKNNYIVEIIKSEAIKYVVIFCMFAISMLLFAIMVFSGSRKILLPAFLIGSSVSIHLLTQNSLAHFYIDSTTLFFTLVATLAVFPPLIPFYLVKLCRLPKTIKLNNVAAKTNGILSVASLGWIYINQDIAYQSILISYLLISCSLAIASYSLFLELKSKNKSVKYFLPVFSIAAVSIVFEILQSNGNISLDFPYIFISALFTLVAITGTTIIDLKESIAENYQKIVREKIKGREILQEKLQVIATMSAGIAHEINNPLAITHASATKYMREVSKNEETKDKLDIDKIKEDINSSIKRIKNITQTIDIASKTNKELFNPLYISKILFNAIGQNQTSIPGFDIETKFESTTTAILGIEDHLTGSFSNLLKMCWAEKDDIADIELETNENQEKSQLNIDIAFQKSEESKLFSNLLTTRFSTKTDSSDLYRPWIIVRVIENTGGSIKIDYDKSKSKYLISIKFPLLNEESLEKPTEQAQNTAS